MRTVYVHFSVHAVLDVGKSCCSDENESWCTLIVTLWLLALGILKRDVVDKIKAPNVGYSMMKWKLVSARVVGGDLR